MKALVLSGGGSKGAWQIGVLKYFQQQNLYVEGFDIICGTSVGAINAAGLSQFQKGFFHEGISYCEDIWMREVVKTSSIWHWRFPRYIAGFWNKSLGDTKGLRKILEKNIDPRSIRDSGIKLRIPAVNLVDGNLTYFNEEFPNIVEAIMASAAFPIFFPPVRINSGLYLDGGIRDIAPLKAAIKEGATEIVVLSTENPYAIKPKSNIGNVTSVAFRTIEIIMNEILLNDIKRCLKVNYKIQNGTMKSNGKKVINIKVYFPIHPLVRPLDFNKKLIEANITSGYNDAKFIHNRSDSSGCLLSKTLGTCASS